MTSRSISLGVSCFFSFQFAIAVSYCRGCHRTLDCLILARGLSRSALSLSSRIGSHLFPVASLVLIYIQLCIAVEITQVLKLFHVLIDINHRLIRILPICVGLLKPGGLLVRSSQICSSSLLLGRFAFPILSVAWNLNFVILEQNGVLVLVSGAFYLSGDYVWAGSLNLVFLDERVAEDVVVVCG